MTQSIVGLFNSFTEANGAKQALIKQGFSPSDIAVSAHEGDMSASSSTGKPTTSETHTEGGFMKGVENFFADLFGSSDNETAGHYSEAVRRGGAVVTVTVDEESKIDNVRSALASIGAVNIEERVAAWRETGGYTGYQKNSSAYTSEQIAEERSRVIPVIQEDIEIGKRQVDLGSVRVVSRIVETPVSESVTLREEHATIERRPVDRPASDADLAGLQGQSIEVRETAEKAVVSKTANVVEEVIVGKEATTHTEQIADTVRSTVVDVDQTGVTQNIEGARFKDANSTDNVLKK
nr:YsnF/AvaK domain-containing protein [uncultured Noviherbaspirillum sp.]